MNQKPVMLNDGTRRIRIDLQEVAYVQADRVYCYLMLKGGRRLCTLSRPMGEVLPSLPAAFVRISRSVAVNVWHIRMVMGRSVTLDDGTELLMGGGDYRHALDGRFCELPELMSGK